jgi:hypothetical protein
MADKYRDQVNTARRAGYTDAEIIDHLKGKDPKVATALDQGYTADEILSHIAPMPTMGEKLTRATGITARAATPSLVSAGLGATAGAALGAFGGPAAPISVPVGALAGSVALPVTDLGIMAYNYLANKNIPSASETIKNKLVPYLPKPETTGERMLDVASSAITPAGIEPAAANLLKGAPGMLGRVGKEVSRAPVSQLVTAPTSAALAQGVTETSGNPLLGLATGVAAGTAGNIRAPKRVEAPSAEILDAKSKANYDILDQSGFQLNNDNFKSHFENVPAKLRADIGYVEGAYPKVDMAIKELRSDQPKDVAELSALRKIIGAAKGSSDAQERKIASQLMDTFDEYVLNAPTNAIIAGDKKAIEAWKTAREDYSRVKKGEIFTDILDKAELSQGDKGKAIASQISALAKNDKKMRLFSPAEQEEIKKVARGGPVQSLLNTAAKFTPMTPAAAIFTAVNPWGAYTAAGGMAAKSLATSRQERQANNLAQTMRAGLGGRPPIIEGAMRNLPITSYREATNALNLNNQNALAQ